MSIFSFTIPTRIEYGIDATARLGHFTSSLGDRVIVITENVLSQSQAVQHIESVLKGKGIEALVYDGVFPNAESNTVDEIAQLARKSRVNVVVGIGGTRICSIAKLVSFLCKNEGEMADYMHGKEGNGKRVPYIEIPTTFREVYALTDSAFITDAFDQVNKVLSLNGLRTDVLVDDPAIMAGIQPVLSAYTALDILALSIEGYISLKVNPLVEPVLLRGIEIVYYNLGKYIKNPMDVSIREKLCTAGLFTAIANIITGFGIGFALSMGMNGKNRISKSIVTSMLIPYIMEYNLAVSAPRLAKIARVMGKKVAGLPETEAASMAIEGFREFRDSLGVELKHKIGQLGLEKDDLAEAAEVAIRFEDINSIPRKASFENLMEILLKAY